MTDKEMEIGAKLMQTIITLTIPQRQLLLAYGSGMADANAVHQANAVRDQPDGNGRG